MVLGFTFLAHSQKRVKKKTRKQKLEQIQLQENAVDVDKMDSIWRQELYQSDLYNDIRDIIQNADTETPVTYKELPTETLKARLESLDHKTPFNIEYNPILENLIKKNLKGRRSLLEKMISLSYYYFPIFEKELDQYDLPLELKYLAVVESGLRPKIKSSMGATGLWQFMYQTGKMQGLVINSYVDERMDPLKSTKAACEYLSSLYKTFGDWDLALAAYNSGPGNVLKALKRARGKKNYWNIRRYLPRETAGYVPAFLAYMYIFEHAKYHNLTPHKPEYLSIETDTVKIKTKVTFKEISKAIQIDYKELQFLNPAYKLNIIPKSRTNKYSLRLPVEKMKNFIKYEQKLYKIAAIREDGREKSMYHNYDTSKKFVYHVRRGDYLSKIAQKFKVSVSNIKSWNRIHSSKIKVGQALTIYPNTKLVSSAN
ncbi:lytic transglycosylase domain-containing protein [Aquimarina agarilytica]|uniref:lytic transglycosylase domain-containing protein n=1 Tax=Aquimarina agarilytica TaxID=1087449 RepID=UPI0002896DE0|nr:lytic transglycosylase domain-containing protein [Aquimarina agarilytica]